MNNKVDIFCWSTEEYLHTGDSFGNCLSINLLEVNERHPNHKEFKSLRILLEELTNPDHPNNKNYAKPRPPEDILDELFNNTTTLDFDFVKSLQLFDAIDPACFMAKDENGKILIELAEYSSLRFVLSKRHFLLMDRISIWLQACHEDYDDEYISTVRTNGDI